MAIVQWEKAIHIDTACRCVDLVGLAIQKREETIIENFGVFHYKIGRLKFSDQRKPNRPVIVPEPFVTTMRAMTGGKRDVLKTYATLVFQTLKTGMDMDTPIMTINGFGRFFKQKRKYGFIPKTAKRMQKVMAIWAEDAL
jgi:nucleoid DNA-binding protein